MVFVTCMPICRNSVGVQCTEAFIMNACVRIKLQLSVMLASITERVTSISAPGSIITVQLPAPISDTTKRK